MLEKDIPELSCGVTLMIVDSIAGPIRAEYEADSRRERISSIHKLGYLLNGIARKMGIPVIVTNQVTMFTLLLLSACFSASLFRLRPS